MIKATGFETHVTRRLGCNHPILLGGMQVPDHPDDLATATLSGAFCFFDLEIPKTDLDKGQDGAGHAVNRLDCPIGCRIPDGIPAAEALQAAISCGATAVLCSFAMCTGHGALFREAGLVTVCEISTVPEAINAHASGADLLILRSGADGSAAEKLVRSIQAVSDATLILHEDALDGVRLVKALACGAAGIYCKSWRGRSNSESPGQEIAGGGAAEATTGTGSSTEVRSGRGGASISHQVGNAVADARDACDLLLGAVRTEGDCAPMVRFSLSEELDPVHYAKLRDGDLVAALASLLKLQLEGARTCAIGYQEFTEPVERGIVRKLARDETKWVHQLAGRVAELTSGTAGSFYADVDMAAGVPEVGSHPALRLNETVLQTITLLDLIVPLTRNTDVGAELRQMLFQQREVQSRVEALASGHADTGVVRLTADSRMQAS